MPKALQDAIAMEKPRTNWTKNEIADIYNSPLSQLVYTAVMNLTNRSRWEGDGVILG